MLIRTRLTSEPKSDDISSGFLLLLDFFEFFLVTASFFFVLAFLLILEFVEAEALVFEFEAVTFFS